MLILGESGTGKETVAQRIHTLSPRAKEPFYAFNCASVNKELLESRFFGHEKGSFTGADKQTLGVKMSQSKVHSQLASSQVQQIRQLQVGERARYG